MRQRALSIGDILLKITAYVLFWHEIEQIACQRFSQPLTHLKRRTLWGGKASMTGMGSGQNREITTDT